MRLLSKLHDRLGDLWWYTLLLFVAQRVGDVINLFVGLWLVPKYIPQSELGAVLPLTQFVSLVGLPLGIIAIPFMKFLNVYAERGEYGKVKSLLRDVFIGTGIMAILTFLIAFFLLPMLFERVRVANGSLGILIVGVSILSAIAVIFQNAVQGLKLFSATVWFNVVAAPLRLVLMLVFMPFRPLAGYFVGQGAAPGTSVVGAFLALRKKLGRSVKAMPYWKEDGVAMIRYTIPIALCTIFSVVGTSIEQLIIRHRLSEFESAGYYIISRFADISSYLGSVFVIFLFPLASSRKADDVQSTRLLAHSMFGTLAGGLCVTLFLGVCGSWLLTLQEQWRIYASLSWHMVLLSLVNVTTIMNSCFCTFEMAQGRFRFLWYLLPFILLKSVGMYVITGYTYFEGMLPDGFMQAMSEFNPNRLVVVLSSFLGVNIATTLFIVVDLIVRRKRRNSVEEKENA